MSIALSADDNYDLEGNTGAAGDAGSRWYGGPGTMNVDMTTAGGATVKLQSNEGAGFTDVGSDVEFTDDGKGNFDLPPCEIRINVNGGTAHDSDADVRSRERR